MGGANDEGNRPLQIYQPGKFLMDGHCEQQCLCKTVKFVLNKSKK